MIEQSYIDRVYERLSAMDVELDADPIEFGPSRLNNKTSEVRSYLSNTERIFMEVSHNLQKFKRDLLVAQTEYNMEQSNLIANDPHVRSGRSQSEREALAGTRLVSIQTRINNCTLCVHDLDDLLTVIKAKRTDLKDLQGRLRDQLKLCQEQIALGQRWGSKTYTARSFDAPPVNGTGEASTATLVEDFMNQRQKAEERFAESVDSELDKALGGASAETSSPFLKEADRSAGESEEVLEKLSLDSVDTSNLDEIDLDELFDNFGG